MAQDIWQQINWEVLEHTHRELYKRVALFPWQRFVILFLYG